jgi:tetratricopeptide (TPR) repeat protein
MRPIRLTGLASLMLVIHGCASNPQKDGDMAAAEARYSGTTLGDLENTEVTVEEQSLEDVSAEMALESYRRAVKLFQDPDKRSRSLRRMADLAMESAEEKIGTEKMDKPADEAPRIATDRELDQDIDKMLYENFMQEAQRSENREKKYALLDMAGNVAASLDNAELDTDYDTAILLYQTLLESTEDPAERAEAYYLLAKAHDMNGDLQKSRAALDNLVKEYPESKYYVEAQFRRGELLFSDNQFDYARDAYQEVVEAGPETDFYKQGLYKLGWSHYKLGTYEKALERFFGLVDNLHGTQVLENEKSMEHKLMEDTERSISLAFSNLNGAQSVREWFAERGHKDYESRIYRALGDVYVQQDRFQDAADAYDTFVQVYPDSPKAPKFSSLQIQAYEEGGFPSLVLPAKEKFAEHYGISGDYWKEHPDIREDYAPLLKGHLLDLANHYHAEAQDAGNPEAFNKPARWYSEYLETPPPSDEEARINHLYAETLYSAQRYEEAITEFERTAYQYEDYAEADEAAYFALVAYQSRLEQMPGETDEEQKQKQGVRQARINSGLKFASEFPAHDKVPGVLRNTAEQQLANDKLEAAIETAGMLVNREPAPAEEYLVYGWRTIANGEFDQGRFKVAEFAYDKLLEYPSVTGEERQKALEQLATSVYKQGETWEEQGELDRAARAYARVGRVYPEAEVRKNADFDAATLYIKQKEYQKAIPILESFRQRYPDDELMETVPDKLAVAYEETGNYSAAADELLVIAERYGDEDRELARQAHWRAAEMQERANDPRGSIELYRSYVREYREPWDFRSEAQYKLVQLYDELGEEQNKRKWQRELVTTYEQAGSEASDRVAYLAAQAAFNLAEPRYAEFNSIKLTLPLEESLNRKTTAMKDALEQYRAVKDIGVSEYTTAANHKIGELYRTLAKDMMESERPDGLSDLEKQQYDLLLEEKALPYEDQAIEILISNTDLVTEDIYNKWVKESFEALSKLLPGRYAKHEQVEDYVDIIY